MQRTTACANLSCPVAGAKPKKSGASAPQNLYTSFTPASQFLEHVSETPSGSPSVGVKRVPLSEWHRLGAGRVRNQLTRLAFRHSFRTGQVPRRRTERDLVLGKLERSTPSPPFNRLLGSSCSAPTSLRSSNSTRPIRQRYIAASDRAPSAGISSKGFSLTPLPLFHPALTPTPLTRCDHRQPTLAAFP